MIRVALLQGDAPHLRLDVEDAPGGWVLHPRELASLSRKAVPKRRDDFHRGRWVAHHLLAEALSLDTREIAIVPDADGVPWAEHDERGRLPYSLSISHTGGMAAAALVTLPWRVGVDVEHAIASPENLVRDYFDPGEMAFCTGFGEASSARRAAEVWALKEAGLKALGTGLRSPTSAVLVQSVASQAGVAGWHAVDMMLGASCPEPERRVVGWLRWRDDVVVALSLLAPAAGGNVPTPASPTWHGAEPV